jgi:dTDP-4-dehydrorhamnose reductase
MKILVLGCAGMAGHTISIYLQEKGHEVIGVSRRPITFCHSVLCDVENTEKLKSIIEEGDFDSVINCVGLLNQFAEEDKAAAVFLNSYLPHYLATVTQDTNTQVIHMSTDCVFSGERGDYTEHDFTDGKSFYDRSKALGELNDHKNITLRNSIVGPDINQNGIGLLNWFMSQNGEINGYTKAMWTGLTTLQLAKAMEAAATAKASGLYNMVYDEPISKYDLLQLFNKYLKNDKMIIKPYDMVVADKSLKRTNFDFDYTIPDYEIMVSEMASWIKSHRDLYPHYSF